MLNELTVARFLEQRIALSGKSQRAIAAECGYPNPNIITMFKQGATRLPFTKVPAMARALDVDPRALLRVVMMEYAPDAFRMFEEVMGNASTLSNDELALLDVIRSAAKGRTLRIEDPSQRARLVSLIAEIAETEEARDNAAVERLNALPRNARQR